MKRKLLRKWKRANEVVYAEYRMITESLINGNKLPNKYDELGTDFLSKINKMIKKDDIQRNRKKERI